MAQGLYIGKIKGYETRTKDNVTKHIYYVLVEGKKDHATGLPTSAEVISVLEETQVLKEIKYDAKVQCYGEMIGSKDNKFMRYFGIELV